MLHSVMHSGQMNSVDNALNRQHPKGFLFCVGELGSRDEVAHRAGALADSVLNVAADSNNAALQRSAAEIFAFAACIGSTAFAAALVRTLVQALADSPSAPRHNSSLFPATSPVCSCPVQLMPADAVLVISLLKPAFPSACRESCPAVSPVANLLSHP